jgi:hypothetical protein
MRCRRSEILAHKTAKHECDAKAYCSWAGKRLCGKVGGGQFSMAGSDKPETLEGTNTKLSEWGFTCSQGARTRFPYGSQHQDGACVDTAYKKDHGLDQYAGVDVKSDPTCHGQSSPYDAVYDLVGSVGEFEDAILPPQVVGVRSNNGTIEFDCSTVAPTGIDTASSAVGFRCCAD